MKTTTVDEVQEQPVVSASKPWAATGGIKKPRTKKSCSCRHQHSRTVVCCKICVKDLTSVEALKKAAKKAFEGAYRNLMTNAFNKDFRMQSCGTCALRDVTAQMEADIIGNGSVCVTHAKRRKISKKDIDLVNAIQSKRA
jgi:histone H3/H4